MTTPLIPQDDFNEITQLIQSARQRAVLAVNTALIELYWQVGQFVQGVEKRRERRQNKAHKGEKAEFAW